MLSSSSSPAPTTAPPPDNGDATNYVGFTSTSTPPPSPPAATDEGNAYAGCLGYAVGSSAFQQVEQSPAMTIEQCLSDCFESFYAGVSGQYVFPCPCASHIHQTDFARSCYCGNSLSSTAGLIKYPDSDCDIPCPGDPSETCGGNLANEMSRRRQSIILLTTYNNTANINAVQPPRSTSLPSSGPSSLSIPPTSTMPSSVISQSAAFSSPSAVTISPSGLNVTGAPTAGGIPNSVGPEGGSHFFDPGTSSTKPPVSFPDSSILGSSIQSIPVVISSKFHPLQFRLLLICG
jgi:hypothetical protein